MKPAKCCEVRVIWMCMPMLCCLPLCSSSHLKLASIVSAVLKQCDIPFLFVLCSV
uniref:Uncharacterized protein n=1 Tax=Arundo donax TaxID=35708 RepID=A0A0A9EAN3_ARUDO